MTRFPLTIMWLRCRNMWSQADREFQPWFGKTVDMIARGDDALVRPNWESMRRDMWLGHEDPA